MKKECMFIVTDTIEINIGSVIHRTSCNAEQEHNAISLFVQKKETLAQAEFPVHGFFEKC